jgi:nitric oxide reductase NorQ protein
MSIEFNYPPADIEAEIIERESGCTREQSVALAKLGEKIRNLQEHGLQEGASTRLLIYAGRLMVEGIAARRACQVSIVWTLSDEAELQRSLEEVVSSIFE